MVLNMYYWMHVMGWKLFALLQCFVEWFVISGEEMLGVDTYQTLYNRRGIEGGQPIYRRCADCWKISCSTFVLLTYLSFFCIATSTIACLLFYYLLFTSNADHPICIANIYLSITYPSGIGDISQFGYPVFTLWFYCFQNLFGFPIFRYWAYPMKVIPEARREH